MKKLLKNILWGCLIVIIWLAMYVAYYQTHKQEVLQKSELAALLKTNQDLAGIKELQRIAGKDFYCGIILPKIPRS